MDGEGGGEMKKRRGGEKKGDEGEKTEGVRDVR